MKLNLPKIQLNKLKTQQTLSFWIMRTWSRWHVWSRLSRKFELNHGRMSSRWSKCWNSGNCRSAGPPSSHCLYTTSNIDVMLASIKLNNDDYFFVISNHNTKYYAKFSKLIYIWYVHIFDSSNLGLLLAWYYENCVEWLILRLVYMWTYLISEIY
jgi:hypothetical protein